MKQKIVILLALVGLMLIPNFVYADATYSGYTIVFNPETGTGIVFHNNRANSVLWVVYPSADKVFIYSVEGQTVFTYKNFLEAIKGDSEDMKKAGVATIQPIEGGK